MLYYIILDKDMSFVEDLLTILCSYSGGYKRMRQIINGYYEKKLTKSELKETTLRATLFRLKSQGFVTKKKGEWTITGLGKNYIKDKKRHIMPHHRSDLDLITKKKKNMIIAFDVPESYKKARDWLRMELRMLGFEPIQKSVWFGPAPIPEDFIKTLSELDLLQCLKFFRANEKEII